LILSLLLLALLLVLLSLNSTMRGFLFFALLILASFPLQFLQQFRLFLELFLSILLLLTLQTLLFGELLGSLDLLAPRIQKLLSHFLLPFSLLVLKLLVPLFITLPSIGIISETRPGHRGCYILHFFHTDRGDSVMRKLHGKNYIIGLIEYIRGWGRGDGQLKKY
jgi:hypothetical protein